MSNKMYIIKISNNNLGQIIDGLKQRAEAYHITAEYYVTGHISDDQCIQEVKDEHEAISIRDHYNDIVKDLEGQMSRQNFMETEASSHLANTGGN